MQDQPHKIKHCKIYDKVLTQTITSFLHRIATSISLCSAADSRTEQVSFFRSFVSICSWQIWVWVPYREHKSKTSWTETGSWLLRLNHPVWQKEFESLFRLLSGALSGQITGKDCRKTSTSDLVLTSGKAKFSCQRSRMIIATFQSTWLRNGISGARMGQIYIFSCTPGK